MGNAAANLPMSAEQFLAWDAQQRERWEFVAGEVFAMTGGSVKHATVALNVGMALRRHLKGTPCRTFLNDVKLRVEPVDAYYYPDVMVTCSAADARDPLIQREPLLLVEVLSPSTASYDRGGKFAAYRTLPTLREVLFVDPDARTCDLFRLGDKGLWELHPAAPGADVQLASVDLTITAAVLWDEVPDATSAPSPSIGPSIDRKPA
jgi:Uma2 family endonuclease